MVQRSLIAGCLLLSLVPQPAAAQAGPPASAAPAVPIGETIAAARKLLAERYVLPAVAEKLDQALARAMAAGAFDGLAGDALAARVTAEMNTVTADGHLRLTYQPRVAALIPPEQVGQAPPAERSAWDAALGRQMRHTNGGVSKLELLPGNIRYLAYDTFGWGAPAAERALATAMEFLREADAIIIDLRNNPGGSAFAEAAMASYFLPPGTKLNSFELRGGAPAEGTTTSPVPFTLAGKPTYVLVGPATASAAEGFATHVRTFGFGTLVGATTGGAGYTVRGLPLPGGFILNVSVGRTIDTLTQTDWEGVGVEPSIAVRGDAALAAAQAAAMEALLAGMPEGERGQGARLLAFYRAQVAPVSPGLPLSAYTGRYGEFTVAAEQDRLTIRARDFPSAGLIPIGPEVFALVEQPATQVRFIGQEGAVVALEVDGGNGTPVRTARLPDG